MLSLVGFWSALLLSWKSLLCTVLARSVFITKNNLRSVPETPSYPQEAILSAEACSSEYNNQQPSTGRRLAIHCQRLVVSCRRLGANRQQSAIKRRWLAAVCRRRSRTFRKQQLPVPKGNTTHHTTPRHATPRHATPRRAAPRRAAPHRTAPHHTTPHHTTPHPEYSPALLTGWVPGAKPPTTGPGHCQWAVY